MVATFALAVNNLFVRQDRPQSRTPVHSHLGDIGQPLFVKLLEDPLRPLVVLLIRGVDFAVPVVAEPERLNLFTEAIDVLLRSDRGMRAGLNCVLLSRESKGVPAHRMQHIKTPHALITAENICGGIAFGMTDMQACAAGIGKHVEAIELGLCRVKVIDLERLLRLPVVLPLLLNSCEIIIAHLELPYCLIKNWNDGIREWWNDGMVSLEGRAHTGSTGILPVHSANRQDARSPSTFRLVSLPLFQYSNIPLFHSSTVARDANSYLPGWRGWLRPSGQWSSRHRRG